MIKKINVAWLFPVIPNYRLPLLRHLAQIPDLDVTCFHGREKRGFTVRSAGGGPAVKSVEVKNYFWPFGKHRVMWQAAIKKIVRGPFDAIICQEAIHNFAIWVLLLLKKIHKKRIVLFGYGYRPKNLPQPIWAIRNLIRRLSLMAADAIIVYTDRGREECIRSGIKQEKIFVCNNTLDTEYLMSLERDIGRDELNTLKKRFNAAGGSIILYVGRLVPEKRIDVLLKAFQELQKSASNLVLLVIGEGRKKPELLERAKGLENIHFLGAIYDDRELAKFFLISNLLVIPGRVGLTCIHGFCYGVPVVTAINGVEQSPEIDYIHHEKNGYTVEALRPGLFSNAISLLLSNPDRLNIMSKQARQDARSLAITHMADQFVSAIRYIDPERNNKYP